MKATAAAALALALLAPRPLPAKGATTRIVIEGPALGGPLAITDPRQLAPFEVWSGPGTFSTEPARNEPAPSFIVDWPAGPVAPPAGLERYQVSFYARELGDQPVYVVEYAFAGAGPGYVYLPAPGERWGRPNAASISRGVEGRWFRAWNRWERLARPLLERARKARLRTSSAGSRGRCAARRPRCPKTGPRS